MAKPYNPKICTLLPYFFVNNKKIQIHFRHQIWNEIAFGSNIRMFNYCISINSIVQIQHYLLKLNNFENSKLATLTYFLKLLCLRKRKSEVCKFCDFMVLSSYLKKNLISVFGNRCICTILNSVYHRTIYCNLSSY